MEHGPQISICKRSNAADVAEVLRVKGNFLYLAQLQVSHICSSSTVIKGIFFLKAYNLS